MILKSLEDICIEILFNFVQNDLRNLQTYFKGVVLPERSSQKLLKRILMTPRYEYYLKYFASSLSSISSINLDSIVLEDYRFLKRLNLSSFSSRSTSSELEKFLENFNEETKHKLLYLKLQRVEITYKPLVLLIQLENLKFLDLSKTNLNSDNLRQICSSLKFLIGLNISRTNVESLHSLSNIKNRVEFLDIHFLYPDAYKNVFSLLKSMPKLRYLDISHDQSERVELGSDSDILDCKFLKSILLMDFSGNLINLKPRVILQMLRETAQLKYFVFNPDSSSTNVSHNSEWKKFIRENPQITFIGPFSKTTVLNSLIYSLNHRRYLTISLNLLFDRTKNSPFINETLFETLISHLRNLEGSRKREWMIAMTAVIYNLTRGSNAENWSITQLSEIMSVLIECLSNRDSNQQLVVNAFLVICNDFIIQNARFDKLRLSQLVFDGMHRHDTENINQAGVIILSVIASELTKPELLVLVQDRQNFRILLRLICQRCVLRSDFEGLVEPESYLGSIIEELRFEGEPIFDFILKFALSSMWNLTDECQQACVCFVEQQGLFVYLVMIERFKSASATVNAHVYNKCLGLLNNIAEEESCRSALLTRQYLEFLSQMLVQEDIQMTYFASGILSNLLLISNSEWKNKCQYGKSHYENAIYMAVESWVSPNFLMASYRSFSPFENLIANAGSSRGILIWTLWAIRHTLKIERKKYATILERHPRLVEYIQLLAVDLNPSFGRVKTLSTDILSLYKEDPDMDLNFQMMVE